MGREGYKGWRKELIQHHSRVAAEVLLLVGYPPEKVECVVDLVLKKRLKQDADSQCLEDVVCLVFLRYYFEPFMQTQPAEKLPRIIRRTWALMSPAGHKVALELPLSAEALRIISESLAQG